MLLNLLNLCFLLSLQYNNINTSVTDIKYSIPFKLEHNKVIVPVTIGNSRTYDLILDSGFGFDGIILFRKELADSINLNRRINVQIPGAGDGPPSQGIMSDSMTFYLGACKFINQRIIILQNDAFKDSHTDGVIGYSYFGHYKVEVDYDQKVITLHDTAENINQSEWYPIPLEFDNLNKPHLSISISVLGEEPVSLDVYIDYASSLSIELTVKKGMKFQLPKKFESIWEGYGLSGPVTGKTAFITKLIIGKYEFQNATATFFEGNSRSKDKNADGVISNDALRRFNLIFDYNNKILLIKPNNSFGEPFEIIK